ncbi:hypothetical protein OCHUTO_0401 [Orientia chuto str. Dubai]|uniref:Uncharacterized protein n=1 Tax=Orientia chuto str. Dubai TaxID=1359168 RepID=A0A0F3MJ05_9RICK|nr:hypothetical protein OCHUTO_1125 [Orientia chuto str. Dubai]KJV56646.1 hypothetical protein OCHUTO_0401 [Orientia chuto str. Dubai]
MFEFDYARIRKVMLNLISNAIQCPSFSSIVFKYGLL